MIPHGTGIALLTLKPVSSLGSLEACDSNPHGLTPIARSRQEMFPEFGQLQTVPVAIPNSNDLESKKSS